MPFGLFKDILKSAEDIFKKDFGDSSPLTVEINSNLPFNGAKLTSTTTHNCKYDSALENSLSLEYEHQSGFKLEKLEFAPGASGSFTTETSLTQNDLKLEFKGNDNEKADISVKYVLPQATITANVDASDFKSYGATVSSGVDNIKFGLSADSKNGASPSFAASVAMAADKMFFGLNLTNNFTNIKGLFSFAVDSNVTVAANCTYGTAKKNLGAGIATVYKCNKNTIIKAKADMNKNVNLSVKQAVKEGLTATAWTSVSDFKPASATFGAKIVIG